MKHRLILLSAAAALAGTPAIAQRAETSTTARLSVQPKCLIAPGDATDGERAGLAMESALGAALVTIGAKAAGAAVAAGANALGAALERASQEHGFVAEGVTTFNAYELQPASQGGPTLARLAQKRGCLVLYVPGSQATAFAETALPSSTPPDGASPLVAPVDAKVFLHDIGAVTAPALYVEAEIMPTKDGTAIRPVLVWYREALKGAPAKAAATELHVTLATPGAGKDALDIGTAYGAVQIKLPKMAPGQMLAPWELKGLGLVSMPARPTTGTPDSRLSAANGLYASLATVGAEEKAAKRAADAAARKQQAQNTPATREASIVANEALTAKRAELQKVTTRALSVGSEDVGTTNAKARFVVVRDANKLGLAIGKALQDSSKDVGAAVTTALTPSPEWEVTDTAYLQAITNITAKQREYDAAVAAGDPAAINKASDELVILKARANEAAVAAKRDLPYPSLL
jgi:hypothetical protein